MSDAAPSPDDHPTATRLGAIVGIALSVVFYGFMAYPLLTKL